MSEDNSKRGLPSKTTQAWTGNEKLTFALITLTFVGDAIVTALNYSRGDLDAPLFGLLIVAAVVGLGALVGAWHFKKRAFQALLIALFVSTVGFLLLRDWLNVAIHVVLAFMSYGMMTVSKSVLE